MIALEIADLVLIASRTLGLDTGQVLDLVDVAAAENALAEAQPGSGSAGPALRAATLLHALARQRPLRRATSRSRWRPCCSSWPSTAGTSTRPRPGPSPRWSPGSRPAL